MSRLQQGIAAGVALGLIGAGAWMLSPAAALIIIGGLIWIDIAMGGKRNDPR